MDSGDDASDSTASDAREPRSSGSAATRRDEPALPASASEVQSFSEMVRMAPGLRRQAGVLSAKELVAVCVAAARVRFYDAELLKAVTGQLRKRLDGRGGGLGPPEIVSVLGGLAELNAYDRGIFSAAARQLGAEGASLGLDCAQRKLLLESFRRVKHVGDEAFLAQLAQTVSSERYEAAKDASWKRNLERMYGTTLDLHGSAEDAERAQICKRRPPTLRER